MWILFKSKMQFTVKLCEYFLMNDKEDVFIKMFVEGNTMLEYKIDGGTWMWEKFE